MCMIIMMINTRMTPKTATIMTIIIPMHHTLIAEMSLISTTIPPQINIIIDMHGN